VSEINFRAWQVEQHQETGRQRGCERLFTTGMMKSPHKFDGVPNAIDGSAETYCDHPMTARFSRLNAVIDWRRGLFGY
jgi:hypothetical protein